MEEALTMRARQGGILDELTATFPSTTINTWKADVDKWVHDKKGSEDPYEDRTQGVCFCLFRAQWKYDMNIADATFDDVRKMLEAEEAEENRGIEPLHKTSAAAYIQAALKLEERQ